MFSLPIVVIDGSTHLIPVRGVAFRAGWVRYDVVVSDVVSGDFVDVPEGSSYFVVRDAFLEAQ